MSALLIKADEQNVFYSYRGPQVLRTTDNDEIQLENNLTHAFIVTLRHLLGNEQKRLLESLTDSKLNWNMQQTEPSQIDKIYLQKTISTVKGLLRNCRRVWLIAISPEGIVNPKTIKNHEYGDKPDAWIFGDDWGIALEIKTGKSEVSQQQLDSYESEIKKQGGISSVITRHLSWRRDISPTIESLAAAKPDSRVGQFLLDEFGRYLEMEGLGIIRFNRNDFLNWDERKLKPKIESLTTILENVLAKTFTACLGKPQSKVQYARADYIGSNLWHTNHGQPPSVLHWSLGLERYEPRLRLFVQCEGAELSKKIAMMNADTQKRLVKALEKLHGDPQFQLRVEEKWFVMQAGKDERKSIYPVSFSRSLGDCQDNNTTQTLVENALKTVRRINDDSNQKRIKAITYLDKHKRGRTIVGVLQLDFSLNWFELENINQKVEDHLIEAAKKMSGYYEVLHSEFAE